MGYQSYGLEAGVKIVGRWPTALGEKFVSAEGFVDLSFFAVGIDSNSGSLVMTVMLQKLEERRFGRAGCY
jgi:hypothetical protein